MVNLNKQIVARDTRASAQALKQHFLDMAGPLVDQYVHAAIGDGELLSTNADAREQVWDVLSKLILQASDKIDINIQNAQDVIKAVTAGKCTLQEGQDLLKLYKTAKEIETSGAIAGVVDSGLTINILNSSSPQDTVELEPITLRMEDA